MTQNETAAQPPNRVEGDLTARLTPAAARALAEAEARRAQSRQSDAAATEVGGRTGPDPIRYGDWEKGGIVSDF